MKNKSLDFIIIICTFLFSILANYSKVFTYFPLAFIIIILLRIFYFKIILKKNIILKKSLLYVVCLLFILEAINFLRFYNDVSFLIFINVVIKKYCFFIIYIYLLFINADHKFLLKINNLLTIFIYFNIIFIIKDFMSGVSGDNINGLFGTAANGLTLEIWLLVIIINLTNDDRKSKINTLILTILLFIYIGIAEVKFGYFVVPLCFIVYFILSKKIGKKLILALIMICLLFMSYNVLIKYFPNSKNFFNLDFVKEYTMHSYNRAGDINRLDFFNTLKNTVLCDNNKLLFGVCSGNVSYSTNFSNNGRYAIEFKYYRLDGFSIPLLLAENGLIGSMLYLLVFIILLIDSLKIYFRNKQQYSLNVILICIISFGFMIYSNQITSIYSSILITWVYILLNYQISFKKSYI